MSSRFKTRRRGAGYAQEQFAAEMRVAVSTVRAWEKGENRPYAVHWPRICRLLDVSIEQLADMFDDSATGGAVDRRRFLADAGAVTAAAAIPTPPGTTTDILSYLRDQLPEHYRADALLGPERVLPTVSQQTGTLVSLAASATGDLRTQLWQTATAYAGLSTWLHQAAGDMHGARNWAARTVESAHRAGDRELTAHALVNVAMLDTDERDGHGTVELTAAALGQEHKLCAKVRVQGAQQEAHGWALIGDRGQVDAALSRAESLVGKVDDDFPWGNAVQGARYLDAQRATCYTRLGLGAEAASLWSDVLSDPDVRVRDRGVFHARLAAALAHARRPEEAVSALAEACTTGDIGSGRIRTELREAWCQLSPWHTSAPGRRARRILKIHPRGGHHG